MHIFFLFVCFSFSEYRFMRLLQFLWMKCVSICRWSLKRYTIGKECLFHTHFPILMLVVLFLCFFWMATCHNLYETWDTNEGFLTFGSMVWNRICVKFTKNVFFSSVIYYLLRIGKTSNWENLRKLWMKNGKSPTYFIEWNTTILHACVPSVHSWFLQYKFGNISRLFPFFHCIAYNCLAVGS